ncbi:MAG: hypothetical protein DMG00_17300 [Acidobacteria bacterium]|nr:MAG: hypothetical protein DMG00_17300 [Acidobacteriota bacterium]
MAEESARILRVPQHYTARLIRQQQISVTSVQRRCRVPPMILADSRPCTALEAGEDLMTIEIGETVSVRRAR